MFSLGSKLYGFACARELPKKSISRNSPMPKQRKFVEEIATCPEAFPTPPSWLPRAAPNPSIPYIYINRNPNPMQGLFQEIMADGLNGGSIEIPDADSASCLHRIQTGAVLKTVNGCIPLFG